MNNLKVTLIQSPLHWENIDENLKMFSEKISSIKNKTDIIILPEMFNTGFTMNPKPYGEITGGKSMQWLDKTAREKNCIITGSIIIEEKGNFYNRLIWQRPDGSQEHYNKKHLFRYAHENDKYAAGTEKLIIEHNGWKICPMICYDLRFPAWIRNKVEKLKQQFDYDVLIFVANWPERRSHPWKTLLQARAMENQCFVIGVNRIGTDGNSIIYSGDSMAVNPKGDIISSTKAHQESVETVTLSYTELDEWRKTFPAWLDADTFSLNKE